MYQDQSSVVVAIPERRAVKLPAATAPPRVVQPPLALRRQVKGVLDGPHPGPARLGPYARAVAGPVAVVWPSVLMIPVVVVVDAVLHR